MNISSTPSMSSLLASPRQGIARAIQSANRAGERLAAGELDAQAMIDLNEAEILVKANAAVLRTGDEMLGTLLNRKV